MNPSYLLAELLRRPGRTLATTLARGTASIQVTFAARAPSRSRARAIARAKGNKTKAAKLLGMTRPRLYRRLVQLGLEQPDRP